MEIGTIAGLLLFLAVTIAIVAPLLATNAPSERLSPHSDADLDSKHNVDLNEELELDYKIGKVSESDYLALKR